MLAARKRLWHGGLPTLRQPPAPAEPLDAEGPDGGIGLALEHQPRNGVGGDRRQQNSVAMMAGRIDQPLERPAAEDRRVVAAAGPMADPHLVDRQFLDGGHGPPGRFEQRQHAARGQRVS